MPLTIRDLIDHVGIDNVKVQPLNRSIEEIRVVKNGESRVSFLTDQLTPADLVKEPVNVGLVLWMPSHLVAQVVQARRSTSARSAQCPVPSHSQHPALA